MSTEQLSITIANLHDAELLTYLSQTTFTETFAQYNKKEDMDTYLSENMGIERLTEELNDKASKFFLACYNDEAIGYAKVCTGNEPEELANYHPMEIARIYLLRKYQDKHLGTELINYCFNYAAQQGHNLIWLGVWEHNSKAIGFYQKLCFQAFGSHIFLLGKDEQTDILMKKLLPDANPAH